jgi:hypothetical protein
MLKRKESEQMQLELVTYDLLVRPDHLLRKIDAVIDFSFIHDLCAPPIFRSVFPKTTPCND